MLTEESNILSDYIIPEYEVLHTQSKDYIVEDIISLMRERGIELLISEGVSDLHCMSDEYLTEELISEYKEK